MIKDRRSSGRFCAFLVITIVWRGTPSVDDWVAYIAKQPKSKRLILLDGAAERRVKTLLSRLQTMPKKEVEKLAKG